MEQLSRRHGPVSVRRAPEVRVHRARRGHECVARPSDGAAFPPALDTDGHRPLDRRSAAPTLLSATGDLEGARESPVTDRSGDPPISDRPTPARWWFRPSAVSALLTITCLPLDVTVPKNGTDHS